MLVGIMKCKKFSLFHSSVVKCTAKNVLFTCFFQEVLSLLFFKTALITAKL